MNELDALRQEAETLKNAIRVSEYSHIFILSSTRVNNKYTTPVLFIIIDYS